jgi:hypothetical protein
MPALQGLAEIFVGQLAHGPHGHSAHQRGPISEKYLHFLKQIHISGVSCSNKDVSQEPIAPCAFNRRTFEADAKGTVVKDE